MSTDHGPRINGFSQYVYGSPEKQPLRHRVKQSVSIVTFKFEKKNLCIDVFKIILNDLLFIFTCLYLLFIILNDLFFIDPIGGIRWVCSGIG